MSLVRTVLLSSVLIVVAGAVMGQTAVQFPGGWVKKQGMYTRARYTASQIQSFVPPTRGAFTFPAPYNTRGIRITDASDCGKEPTFRCGWRALVDARKSGCRESPWK